MSEAKVKPINEHCECCGAPAGTTCEGPPGCVGFFCSVRWDRANETWEGEREDRLERRRDTMADYRCSRGGPT